MKNNEVLIHATLWKKSFIKDHMLYDFIYIKYLH